MSETPGPYVEKALAGLKDFQRDTVEYVFGRLYTDVSPTRRFLIADEVGLGKTLVARGVVARAIEHLWAQTKRIDVIYVCSNAEIARQNINRLRVKMPGMRDVPLASRIGLLPTRIADLQGNKVNFISLTPGTSFDLKSSLGQVAERALLFHLLREAWGVSDRNVGPQKVLQGGASLGTFRWHVEQCRHQAIEPTLTHQFLQALASRGEMPGQDYRSRFESLCDAFRHRKKAPSSLLAARARLIGELRLLLAESCIEALEPDLVILDEFQRFKHLLHPQHEAGRLAHRLFEYTDQECGSKSRVLLLSATPYKMYTVSGEAGDDDHYRDFVETLEFLVGDESGRAELRRLLAEYGRELYRLGDSHDTAGPLERLQGLKLELETRLRRVMVRTERLAVTEKRDGMLAPVPVGDVRVQPRDLAAYVALQEVSGLLSQMPESRGGGVGGDLLEYWKTAPYLLNFMEARNYKFKQVFQDALKAPTARKRVSAALSSNRGLLFPWDEWSRYEEIDPANARLRGLLAGTIGVGAWRFLWMPPALPYYKPDGPFAAASFTKRLVFSGWNVVPKAISSMVSYEAERRMVREAERDPGDPGDINRWRRPLLRFARTDGRLTGMPILGIMYPSVTLAEEGDPLFHAGQLLSERAAATEALPPFQDVLGSVEARMAQLLASLDTGNGAGQTDESWYWAAPILLDLRFDGDGTRHWLSLPDLASRWNGGEGDPEADGEESRWADHVNEARRLLNGELRLGAPPADLPRVLALLAIGGPGVAALRALAGRAEPFSNGGSTDTLRDAAARIGWAFRNLFNRPEAISLVRGRSPEPYWRRVIDYCAAGNLQAVLDEYAHVLGSLLGLSTPTPAERATALSEAMQAALRTRAVTVVVDDVDMAEPSGRRERRPRLRFAARYAADETEGSKEITRPGQVRDAFNSPFWPFVLATTSVGQEGLDFHPYCHAVVHWDLPSNPVDLEQREGRVHRYKGHAVRKNLALRYGREALKAAARAKREPTRPDNDPWEYVFDAGKRDRPAKTSDLVPFWVYALDGGARVERHVPTLPLSRDVDRLKALRRSLALYRIVFGQPRQEDLLAFLLTHIPEDQAKQALADLRIDLAPPKADGG